MAPDGRVGHAAARCFFEPGQACPLARRAGAEALGTLLLVLAATGGALASDRLAATGSALGLLVAALGVSGALVGLILAFAPVSGGHFNPLITLLQWVGRERDARSALAYVGAQVVGALAGAALANGLVESAAHERAAAASSMVASYSEFLAAAALMVVVRACSHAARPAVGPFAVGSWLMAAILATPTLSLANPAMAVACLVAQGPMALDAGAVARLVGAQLGGAFTAFGLVGWIFRGGVDR